MTFPFTIPVNYEYGYAEIFANKDAEQTTDCLVKEQEAEKQLVEVDVVTKVGFSNSFHKMYKREFEVKPQFFNG